MTVPSFYILGGPKCGARTVESWLKDRDDVFLPSCGSDNFHATDLQDRVVSTRSYQRAFEAGEEKLIGEVSCWYLYSDTAITNILTQNPDAKFIVCLHDPAEVAWTLHSDYISNSIEHIRDFNTAWALSFARRQGRGARMSDDPKLLDYASICAFGHQVARLMSLVPKDRIHFIYLDDLRRRPIVEWRNLEVFLDLKHCPRNTWPIEDFVVQRPLLPLHEVVLILKRVKRKLFPRNDSGIGFVNYINGINRRPGVIKPMPEEARQKVSDRLSEDIATLSVLTERDLTHWIY
jgi:hypothetical protein